MTQKFSEELEDVPQEEPQHAVKPAVAARDLYPQWTGRSSKVRVAFGRQILRDHQWVSGGSANSGPTECIDCLKSNRHTTEHQFHAKAAKLPREQWYRKKTKRNPAGTLISWTGPEGETMQSHESDGLLSGSRREREHNEQQRLVDLIRGILPEDRCRLCRTAIPYDEAASSYEPHCPSCSSPNGLAELSALTYEDVLEQWEGVLPHERALDIERAQIRDELKSMGVVIGQTNTTLVEGLEKAIKSGNQELIAGLAAAITALAAKNGNGAK